MEKAELWIEEWLGLWPEEVKSGGESVRTKAKYCVKKMEKFVKEHPAYTKDAIFAATVLYLTERKRADWFAIRRATYFIDKQGVGSLLADFCEKIQHPPNIEEPDPEYDPIKDFIN